eukprot:GEMP01041013.1.p1 GENE.GEMP01041013.1~~GEMP01041013.1.p1  ORF type:complete len:291 (+),score=58.47 GEMP01041013.1:148-1020(+)
MTRPQSVAKPNAYVQTQFAIKARDPFSHIFLMSVSCRDMLVMTVISFLPVVVVCLFAYHLSITLGRPDENGKVKPPTLYKPKKDVEVVEYIIIVVVCVARLLPNMLDLMRVLREGRLFLSFWSNSSSFGGRMLLAGFVRVFVDLFILPLATLALSIFVAFYNSSSVLSVVFNILLFGFLLGLDENFVELYFKLTYPTAYVELILTDVVFTAKGGESAFWAASDYPREEVFAALKEASAADTTATWVFRVLTSARTGLGISHHGGTKCKLHVAIRDSCHLRAKPKIGQVYA